MVDNEKIYEKVFWFQAQNSADREPKTAMIHLLVEYAPQVEIKIDHTPLFEGEAVVFTCVAHSNPPASENWG